MIQERYREAAEHAVKEGVVMSSCPTCQMALEALSKIASREWVLCKPNHRETEGGILKWTEYDPVELP
jgi:hypothetical protein